MKTNGARTVPVRSDTGWIEALECPRDLSALAAAADGDRPRSDSVRLLFVLMALLCIAAAPVHAQSFSIDWFTIDGGGGTSTGGVYSVSGTIGQPDAGGSMTGGVYSVTGGFWPGVNLIQTPGAPLLAAELLPGGNVRIFWPLPATGFVLDQTAALASPPAAISWGQVAFPYQTNATHISLTVPAAGNKFYRLRKP